jgi:two-component system, cell cycle sensor histidine kinase and response regulator CckA
MNLSKSATFSAFLMRAVACLALLLWGQACLAATTSLPDAPKSIRVVMDDNYPPYVFRDAQGRLQGIIVDQWALWEKVTGVRAELTGMDWAAAQRGMQAGRFDVIDTMFRNESRDLSYDFSKPFADIPVPLFFHRDISGIRGPDDVRGFVVAAKEGDNVLDILRKHGVTSIVAYPSYQKIIEAARDGKVKVFTVDQPPALYYLNKLGIQGDFQATKPLYHGLLHRAVRKGNSGLLAVVDKGFASIDKAEYRTVDERWMGHSLSGAPYSRYLRYAAGALALLLLALLAWLSALKRLIASKTRELAESEQHHRSILHRAMDGIWLFDTEGRLLQVNDSYCRLSGYGEQELLGRHISELVVAKTADDIGARIEKVRLQGEDRFESRHRRKDGSVCDVEVSLQYRPARGGQLVAFIRDISDRKSREDATHQTDLLLQLANSHSDLRACMSALTASLQTWSGCEAVGIRLREGDHYRHFETRGFPPRFHQAEARLCASGPDGKLRRNAAGDAVPKCLCDTVLRGACDPGSPLVSPRGSYWSNHATAPHAGISGSDTGTGASSRCPLDACASVALVPMRAGGQIIGLLQVSDRREARFSPSVIAVMEGMADNVALTLVRRKAEDDLHKSENHFRTLVNTIPDLVWLKDAEGVYLSCNPTFESFFGAREADIVGKTDYDFVPREQADFFRENDRRVMAEDGPRSNEEWVSFASDGRRALLYTTKMPMKDAEGRLIGVLGISRDITQLKLAEEAIVESESRLRYALEGSNDGLWDVQYPSGKTYLSPRSCEILGYREDEIAEVMSVWSDLIHPEDLRLTGERLQAHLDGRATIFEVEQRLRTKSCDWKWIHTRGKVVERDPDGGPLRITGTHSDITEKKMLESQLHQAQKMESVGQLAGGVAHDFNNMLAVIIGYSELALMRTDASEPVYAELLEIRSAAQRSADLTRQLLAFARKQTIAPRVVDLNVVVGGMLKMLQRLIGEQVNLQWHPAPNLWLVKVDPSQVDQILANLCVNARDSITGVGRITIATGSCSLDADYCSTHPFAEPGEYVQLVVGDNGCGMDQETELHIFEPFYTTKGVGEGTGLGLATVYGIVKQNNGFIKVDSQPGAGTSFTIYLPRHLREGEQVPREDPVEPLPHGNETILLVEDEPTILTMAAQILEGQGYTVLTAGTASEAIRLFQEQVGGIDLLLTDVVMPDMNGRDLVNALHSQVRQLKCLYMSGYTADVIAPHGVLDEGAHFIQKPFSLSDLAKKVRDVLDGQ